MPAAKQEERIPVSTAAALADYFAGITTSLAEVETEDSWQRLDKALAKLEAITKGGGYKFEEYIGHMKSIAQPICNSLLSERTKLSGTAIDLMNSVAPRLADRFEALVPIFVPSLLTICGRTNKVALGRAKKTLLLIAKHCRLASLLPLLREASKEKVPTLRVAAVETASVLVECIDLARANKRVTDVEAMVKGCATDSNPEVRQLSKRLFSAYVERWPERVEQFTINFTPTIRRYLALPKTGAYKPAGLTTAAAVPLEAVAASASRDAPVREAELRSAKPTAAAQPAPESHLKTQLSTMRAAPRGPAPSSSLFGGAMGAPSTREPRRAPTLDVLARSTSSFSLSHGSNAPVSAPIAAAPIAKPTFSTSSTLASSSSSVLSAYAAQLRPAVQTAAPETRTREKSRGNRDHAQRPERQRTVSHSEAVAPVAATFDARPKLGAASLSSSVVEQQQQQQPPAVPVAPSDRVAEQLLQLSHEHQQRLREASSRGGEVTPPVSSDAASASAGEEESAGPIAPLTARATTRVKATRVAVVMPPSTVKRQPQPSASRVTRTLPRSNAALGFVLDVEEQGTPTAAPSRNKLRGVKTAQMLAAEPEPEAQLEQEQEPVAAVEEAVEAADEGAEIASEQAVVAAEEVSPMAETEAEPESEPQAETVTQEPETVVKEAEMEQPVVVAEPEVEVPVVTAPAEPVIAIAVPAPVAAPVASTGPSAKIAAALRPAAKPTTSTTASKAPVKPSTGLGEATAPRRPAPLLTAAAKARAASTSAVTSKAGLINKPAASATGVKTKVAGPSAGIAARAGKPMVGRSVSAAIPSAASTSATKSAPVRAPLAAPRAPAAPVRPTGAAAKAAPSNGVNKPSSSTTAAPKPKAPISKPSSGPASRPAVPRTVSAAQPVKPVARPVAAAKPSVPTAAAARKAAPAAGPSARLTKVLADKKAASKPAVLLKKPTTAAAGVKSTAKPTSAKAAAGTTGSIAQADTVAAAAFPDSPAPAPAAPPGSPMPTVAAEVQEPETPQPERVERLRNELVELLGEAPLSAHAPESCIPPLLEEAPSEEREAVQGEGGFAEKEEEVVVEEEPAPELEQEEEVEREPEQLEEPPLDAGVKLEPVVLIDVVAPRQVDNVEAEVEKVDAQESAVEAAIEIQHVAPDAEAETTVEEEEVAATLVQETETCEEEVQDGVPSDVEAEQVEEAFEEQEQLDVEETAELEPEDEIETAQADVIEAETEAEAEVCQEEQIVDGEDVQEQALPEQEVPQQDAEAPEAEDAIEEDAQPTDEEVLRPSTPIASAPISAAASPARTPRSAARSARVTPARTPLLLSSSNGVPLSARASPAAATPPIAALKYKSIACSPLKAQISASPRTQRKPLTRAAAAAAQVDQDASVHDESYDNENEEEEEGDVTGLYDSDVLPDDSVEMVRFAAPTREMATSPLKLQRAAAPTLRAAHGDASADTVLDGSDNEDEEETDFQLRTNRVNGRLQLVCGAGAEDHPYSDTLPASDY